jgi:hypothetical protein
MVLFSEVVYVGYRTKFLPANGDQFSNRNMEKKQLSQKRETKPTTYLDVWMILPFLDVRRAIDNNCATY